MRTNEHLVPRLAAAPPVLTRATNATPRIAAAAARLAPLAIAASVALAIVPIPWAARANPEPAFVEEVGGGTVEVTFARRGTVVPTFETDSWSVVAAFVGDGTVETETVLVGSADLALSVRGTVQVTITRIEP